MDSHGRRGWRRGRDDAGWPFGCRDHDAVKRTCFTLQRHKLDQPGPSRRGRERSAGGDDHHIRKMVPVRRIGHRLRSGCAERGQSPPHLRRRDQPAGERGTLLHLLHRAGYRLDECPCCLPELGRISGHHQRCGGTELPFHHLWGSYTVFNRSDRLGIVWICRRQPALGGRINSVLYQFPW